MNLSAHTKKGTDPLERASGVSHSETHNLNIHSYSFPELLGLFHLDPQKPLTLEDMKHAKLMVLRMHPDKSRLPSQYFLFYKKALDIVASFYENQEKVRRPVPVEPVVYKPKEMRLSETKVVAPDTSNTTKQAEFRATFNRLFEENMVDQEKRQKQEENHQWFRDETAAPVAAAAAAPPGNTIHQRFEHMKQAQNTQQVAVYQEARPLHAVGMGDALYETDSGSKTYIAADPFGKLKYDDLRKVHHDQTILSVSERDLDKVTLYRDVNKLRDARSSTYEPMDKATAMRTLSDQEARQRQMYQEQEYMAKLQGLQNEEKNNQVRAHFLRLTEGSV